MEVETATARGAAIGAGAGPAAAGSIETVVCNADMYRRVKPMFSEVSAEQKLAAAIIRVAWEDVFSKPHCLTPR